ncbi:MAG: response regulator transcription factor [Lachnospiraceae bacterium]|nr:response regulator transcription factor [Lachnospiraceae bacterium]
MHIMICDDEAAIRTQIKELIRREDAGAVIHEVVSGRELLQSTQMDICFLDIQLDAQMEGMNGLETAKQLRQAGWNMPLIFITGIKDYVFDAFEVEALGYLLKPIDEEKFLQVYRRAVAKLENDTSEDPILFSTQKMTYSIKPGQIFYVENDRKKVNLHTAEGVIVLYASMQEMEKKLGEGFFRCHRGFLVNMAHIAGYNGDSIRVDNGDTVYLARDKYHVFTRVYAEYLGRKL